MFGVEGVILLFEPRADGWYYVAYSLFVAALLLTLVVLAGLHLWHRGRDGWLGRAGFYVSALGLSCLSVTAVVRIASGREIFDVLFALGFLLAIVGFLLFGVAILKTRLLPAWSAPLPFVGAFGAILLQDKHGAGVLMGVVWALVGTSFRRRLEQEAVQEADTNG